jgi:haloalkane dehalogenase
MSADPLRPSWFDAELLPYDSHWLEVEGHMVHYLDEGDGPLLLMLHGNPTWSFLYRRMIAELAPRFRCVALDYPGYGLSTAREGFGFTAAEQSAVVRTFVDALDLNDITLVVQDWGGPIGLGAATSDRERYVGLVIGNTWAWPSSLWTRSFGQVMGGPITGPLLTERLNLFVRRMIPFMMKRRKLTDAERAMYAGPFPTTASRRPVRVLPHEISAAEPFLRTLQSQLDTVRDRPSLLFWADGDIAFGDTERSRWKSLLTDRTDHLLAGAGHYWQDDAGEEASRVLSEWYDSAGPGHPARSA